jgi:putative DNA primase/helicase
MLFSISDLGMASKDMDIVEKGAYYGRWLLIPFENQVDEKEQDKTLAKKITTKEELSGLLNWALVGLKRLFENNMFNFFLTPEEIETIMLKHNNHLGEFSDECLKGMPCARVTKADMYDYYFWWCNRKNYPALGIKQFGKRLPKFAPKIVAKNDNERFWENYNLIIDRDYKKPFEQKHL